MTESSLPPQPTPQPQMPLSPHTVSPFPRSKRVMKIVLGILLVFLVIIIAGAYMLTQQQMKNTVVPVESVIPENNSVEVMDEMEGWTIYTNNTYNFSFKFPPNWTIGSYGGSNIPVEEADSFRMSGPYENIKILTGGPKYNISIDVSQTESDFQETNSSIVKVLKAGENFVSFKLSSAEVPAQPLEHIEFFDQILSTFEFVDGEEIIQTFIGSNFVYDNDTYTSYTFEYPENCSIDRYKRFLFCNTSSGLTKIHIDAGGHGGDGRELRTIRNDEVMTYPFGEVTVNLYEIVETEELIGTYWINKTTELEKNSIFGFEVLPSPVEDVKEIESIMDQVLKTFQFKT